MLFHNVLHQKFTFWKEFLTNSQMLQQCLRITEKNRSWITCTRILRDHTVANRQICNLVVTSL